MAQTHKVRTYKEYHSVCPSSELGLRPQPPTPLLLGGGEHSLARKGLGESQFRRGAYTVVLFICTYFVLKPNLYVEYVPCYKEPYFRMSKLTYIGTVQCTNLQRIPLQLDLRGVFDALILNCDNRDWNWTTVIYVHCNIVYCIVYWSIQWTCSSNLSLLFNFNIFA